MCVDKSNVIWCSKWSNLTKIIWQYGDFPNVPLMGTRTCINLIRMRQHGYPIRGPPFEEITTPFLVSNLRYGEILNKEWHAWEKVDKTNMKDRVKENMRGYYDQWLKGKGLCSGISISQEEQTS